MFCLLLRSGVCSARRTTSTNARRTTRFQRGALALTLDIIILLPASKPGSLESSLPLHRLPRTRGTAKCSQQTRRSILQHHVSSLRRRPGSWPCLWNRLTALPRLHGSEQTPLRSSVPVCSMDNNAIYPGRGGFYFFWQSQCTKEKYRSL